MRHNMDFNIIEFAKKQLIICSHRGAWGGNIPCNSITAFDIALRHGADMVELDVTAGADGELFVFHPGQEERQLNLKNTDIRRMTADEIRRLRYANLDGKETPEPIHTFDEVLDYLKGKCYINVDKFSDNPAAIMKAIERHGMKEQIIVKSEVNEGLISLIEDYAPDLQYIGIIKDGPERHEMLMKRKLNYVGLEVVFRQNDSPIVSEEFMEKVHRDGKLLWGNAIVFNYRNPLAADHGDDVALREDPHRGWGYFAEKGFDIIQTDWPLALSLYLQENGMKVRGANHT